MKKLLLLLVTASFSFAVGGCIESGGSPAIQDTDTETIEQPMEFVPLGIGGDWETPPLPSHDGVELILSNVTPMGLDIEFINNTDKRFNFGTRFRLFERQGDIWFELNIVEDRDFNDIAYVIFPKGKSLKCRYDFFAKHLTVEPLSAGEYMFVVPYSQGGASDGIPITDYSARHVFTIE
ncbi:MAG: hypothetical protein FWG45_03895 [Oscillospiraceae bacterium]|nr:hypothetical protein [Oscillospiraceae bacterium]